MNESPDYLRYCFERFRNAFDALRAGRKSEVTDYLRDLEAKHGRELAERVRTNLIACLKSDGWNAPNGGQQGGTRGARKTSAR
jgi:hypothetical protein